LRIGEPIDFAFTPAEKGEYSFKLNHGDVLQFEETKGVE
jgi:hypothetical protein